jgi:cytochrome c553
MNTSILLAPLLALAVLGNVAQASPPTRPSRLGMCAACHGERGVAVAPGVPNLAAQRYDYLLDAMHQYRDGRRDVAVMRAALGPLSERQLEALAHWYAAQSPARPADGAAH